MAVDMGSAVAYLLLDATNFNTSLQGAQGGLVSAGKVMTSVGATMTATVTKGLINLGKTAVSESANFESAMAQVRATMLKSTEEFNSEIGTVTLGAGETLRTFTGNLTDFALEMAATTKFTATEAAQALNYMALAGYDTQQSMEMLPSVLSLAAAGAMDLALASDMVTDTQTAFGLSAERTKQMVDEMAKVASTGNTSVQQLGEAFLTVGGLAKELNGGFVTLQDGTVKAVDGVQELEIALTAMANAGIKGSEAGTHMRNMLLKLSSPTSDGAKKLQELGVSAFDAQGKMRSLSDIFGDLNVSMSKLTQQEKLQAVADLFNVRDTAAAEAILAAIGEDWNEIGEAILNAEGAADEMSKIQLDNLNGQITILKSSLQVLAIRFGNLLLPAIKKVVQWIQKLSEWLNSLNDTQKMTVMRIALIVAAIGPALLIFGRLISLIGAVSQGFSLLGSVGVGSAGLVVGAFAALAVAFVNLYKTNEDFRNSVTETFEKFRTETLPTIASIFDSLYSAAKPALDAVIGLFEKLILSISKVAKPIAEDVLNKLKEFAESEFVKTFFEDLAGFINDVGDGLVKILESEEVQTFLKELGKLVGNCAELFGKLVGKIQEFVKTTNADIPPVRDIIIEAIGAVGDLLKAINDLFAKDYPGAENNLKSAFEKMNNVFDWAFKSYSTACKGIEKLVDDLVVSIMTKLANSDIPIISSMAKSWLKVHTKIDEIKQDATESVGDLVKSARDKIGEADFSDEGSSAMNTLAGSLKSGWESIKSWFNGLSILNFGSKIDTSVEGFSGGGGGHHFSTGLDYVPRTMNVTVHRGERILTQEENEAYNKGGSIEVTTYQNDAAINKLSSTMDKLLDEVKKLNDKQISLDGKKLVGGLVDEMDRQLGIKAERARGMA